MSVQRAAILLGLPVDTVQLFVRLVESINQQPVNQPRQQINKTELLDSLAEEYDKRL